jgi:hypothetical protein
MLPKTRHMGRLLRAGALTLALTAFIPLAIPLTASASTISPAFQPPWGNYLSYPVGGEFFNNVNADALADQKTVFKVNFQFGQGVTPNINAVNRATALTGRCANCNAIAIGFQVVTATEQDINTIRAVNVASATNYQCTGTCSANANAYQVVVATDTPQPMTFGNLLNSSEMTGLLRIRSEVEALPNSGLPLAQIQTECQNLANDAVTLLENATYTGPSDPPYGGPSDPVYSGYTRPTFSPAVHGAATEDGPVSPDPSSTGPSGTGTSSTGTSSTDQPLVTLYQDTQFKPFSH